MKHLLVNRQNEGHRSRTPSAGQVFLEEKSFCIGIHGETLFFETSRFAAG